MISLIRSWRLLREQQGRRFLLYFGYAVAAVLTFASVYLSTRAPGPGPSGLTSRTILSVVLANLALILALAASVGWRVIQILRARSADAGARLQLRFMTTFALAATRGNQIRAAEILGLNRNTLRKKIHDLGLQAVRTKA